jgi:hypothetical protein
MQLDTVLPPAYDLVRTTGDLFTQLGATKVVALDSTTIQLTYADESTASNAAALLKDSVRGANLLVAGPGGQKPPVATADGIANVLRGVAGLEVYSIEGTPAEIYGVTFDADLQSKLSAIVDRTPVTGVTIEIPKS